MRPMSVTTLMEYTTARRPAFSGRLQLHLWCLVLQMTDSERGVLWAVLSEDERRRAERFRFEKDHDRFVMGRGAVRVILGAYRGIAPDAVEFELGPQGKPGIRGGTVPMEFNLSHAGGLVLIGITDGVPCGVDIEAARDNISAFEIANRFFCPREIEWLSRNPEGFLRLWTSKEAVIKAVGGGLSIPLDSIDVSDVMDGNSEFVTLQSAKSQTQRLWIKELSVPEGYRAAVALTGDRHAISVIQPET
jgi:4'-phosphopantetheinyl transferase